MKDLIAGSLGRLDDAGGSSMFAVPRTIYVPPEYEIETDVPSVAEFVTCSLDGRLWVWKRSRRYYVAVFRWDAETERLVFVSTTILSNIDTIIGRGIDWIVLDKYVIQNADFSPFIFITPISSEDTISNIENFYSFLPPINGYQLLGNYAITKPIQNTVPKLLKVMYKGEYEENKRIHRVIWDNNNKPLTAEFTYQNNVCEVEIDYIYIDYCCLDGEACFIATTNDYYGNILLGKSESNDVIYLYISHKLGIREKQFIYIFIDGNISKVTLADESSSTSCVKYKDINDEESSYILDRQSREKIYISPYDCCLYYKNYKLDKATTNWIVPISDGNIEMIANDVIVSSLEERLLITFLKRGFFRVLLQQKSSLLTYDFDMSKRFFMSEVNGVIKINTMSVISKKNIPVNEITIPVLYVIKLTYNDSNSDFIYSIEKKAPSLHDYNFSKEVDIYIDSEHIRLYPFPFQGLVSENEFYIDNNTEYKICLFFYNSIKTLKDIPIVNIYKYDGIFHEVASYSVYSEIDMIMNNRFFDICYIKNRKVIFANMINDI